MPPRSEHDLSDTEPSPDHNARHGSRLRRGVSNDLNGFSSRTRSSLAKVTSTLSTWSAMALAGLKAFDWKDNGRLVYSLNIYSNAL